jgi:hypothetical protein
VRRRLIVALLAVAAAVGGWAALSAGGGESEHPTGNGALRRPETDRAIAGGEKGSKQRKHRRHARRHRGDGIEIALQDNAVFVAQLYGDRERALAETRALGAGWVRMSVLWYRVAGRSATRARAPRGNPYNWGSYDSAIAAARAHGLRVELSLTGPAPAWASGTRRTGVVRPDAARFGEFAAATARHYRGVVSRYTIWNEPNYVTWLAPRAEAPALYRRLYQAGWSGIKSADPGAQVLFGETAPFALRGRATAPLAFLRAVACAGCPGLHADGYAHHPYDFTNPPDHVYPGADNVTIGTLPRLFGALDSLATAGRLATPTGKPLPVYLTEFGYFASGARALPPSTRAGYLRHAFAIAAGHYPRVRQMLQYMLLSPPRGFTISSFDTSIVSPSGRPGAGYRALSGWAHRAIRMGEARPP